MDGPGRREEVAVTPGGFAGHVAAAVAASEPARWSAGRGGARIGRRLRSPGSGSRSSAADRAAPRVSSAHRRRSPPDARPTPNARCPRPSCPCPRCAPGLSGDGRGAHRRRRRRPQPTRARSGGRRAGSAVAVTRPRGRRITVPKGCTSSSRRARPSSSNRSPAPAPSPPTRSMTSGRRPVRLEQVHRHRLLAVAARPELGDGGLALQPGDAGIRDRTVLQRQQNGSCPTSRPRSSRCPPVRPSPTRSTTPGSRSATETRPSSNAVPTGADPEHLDLDAGEWLVRRQRGGSPKADLLPATAVKGRFGGEALVSLAAGGRGGRSGGVDRGDAVIAERPNRKLFRPPPEPDRHHRPTDFQPAGRCRPATSRRGSAAKTPCASSAPWFPVTSMATANRIRPAACERPRWQRDVLLRRGRRQRR